jgi:hypothetical protein
MGLQGVVLTQEIHTRVYICHLKAHTSGRSGWVGAAGGGPMYPCRTFGPVIMNTYWLALIGAAV